MRQIVSVLVLFTLVLTLVLGAADITPGAERAILNGQRRSEIEWEKKFRAIPQQDRLRENMRRLSARPHHVGSPYDKDNAEWILAQYLNRGGSTPRSMVFDTLFPTPLERSPWICWSRSNTKRHWRNPQLQEDPTSNQKERAAPRIQCLLDRRRCQRAGGVCELRHARRLRATSSAWEFPSAGAIVLARLRRVVARDQTQAGRGTRSNRVPDLFRPAR